MTDQTEKINKIKAHLENGGQVLIATYTKSTIYSKKHVAMFKVGSDGCALVQRGKHWDDFSYCAVRFSK